MTGCPEPAAVLKLAYTAHMFLAYGLHVYERFPADSQRATVLVRLSRIVVELYMDMARGKTAKIEQAVTLAQKMQQAFGKATAADWATLRREVDAWLAEWETSASVVQRDHHP